MRRKTRNIKQIHANNLDLEIFNVIQSIDRFANVYRDEGAREMALIIDGHRHRIRRHMRKADREDTQ